MTRFVRVLMLGMAVVVGVPTGAHAAAKRHFKLAWTLYAGWMPWPYAAEQGIIRRWADKYDIAIDVVEVADYATSISQYTAGAFDALTITNIDTLAGPAVHGIDSTAIIIGDFSNGNDAVVLKDSHVLADVKGRAINLVPFSVSHYLLDRALQSVGLTEKDVRVVKTSDGDMAAAYRSPDVSAIVTWQPILADVLRHADSHMVFDSSDIPGEIIDLTLVRTPTLTDNPGFAMALTGAWYETVSSMVRADAAGRASRAEMARLSGTDLAGFEAQLKTTRLMVTPAEGLRFARGAGLPRTMWRVADFLFERGLMGEDAKSADGIGIRFPGGAIQGDAARIMFRFDDTFMAMAADGTL